jgi:hypothetical protein
MPIKRLSQTSLLSFQKHSNLLAGNPAYSPYAFDLLETTILGTTASSVSFSSLGSYSDYKHLQIRYVVRSDTTTSGQVSLRVNSDSGANYAWHRISGSGTAATSFGTSNQTTIRSGLIIPSDGVANNFAPSVIDILDFSNTNKNKIIRCFYGLHDNVGASNEIALNSGLWNNTAAITSLTFTPPAGNFASGSRFSLYGVK